MKYPQLVSARAVNAISDWLISRLEDLGVDAPVVYSRLLLSLLHTPLQVNALDLAEIPQLKGWFARKNRRLTPSDAEALKKFAAVESLMEVAESDQQKSNVEDLVNELCKRLREIENNSSDYEESVEMEAKTINESTTKAEDPTKRYYRAFPALSNRPFGEEGGAAETSSTLSSALTWPNEMGCGGIGGEEDSVGVQQGGAVCDDGDGGVTSRANNNGGVAAAAGVKRKTKRRRNNGLSKGKSSSFTRRTSTGGNTTTKTSLWDTDFSGNWEMGHDMIRDFIIKQNNRNRSISESDASKFVKIMQAPDMTGGKGGGVVHHHKAACTDEAFKLPLGVTVNEEQTMLIKNMLQSAKSGGMRKEGLVNFVANEEDEEEEEEEDVEETFLPERGDMSPFFASFDTNTLLFGNNMIRDEGYATPDTLTSTSEVESTSAVPPRRLYEREVSNESLNICPQEPQQQQQVMMPGKGDDDKIAKFEAKFNKSVEALWGHDFWHKYYGNYYTDNAGGGTPKRESAAPKGGALYDGEFTATSTESKPIVFNESGWPTKNPSLTDMMAANKDSTTDLHAIWAAPEPPAQPSCSQLFNGRTVDSTWAPKNFDRSQGETLAKFAPDANVMGYPLSDFIGLSKWSDQPFVGCDEEIRRDNLYDECKSLPITSSYASNYAQSFTGKSEALHDDGDEGRVTLINHSKDSHFTVVRKSNHASGGGYGQKFKGFMTGNAAAAAAAASASNDTENLLTSDRTHFRPIKQTFVDGFIFDIPCTPDNIRYERTDTGSMYFDSERYMEYLGREEHAEEVDDVDGGCAGKGIGGNFRLKFCVRQIEKYSQTEDRLLFLSGRMFTEPEAGRCRRDGDDDDDSDVDMTPDIFTRPPYPFAAYDDQGSVDCDDLDLFRQSTYNNLHHYQSMSGNCFGGGGGAGECLDLDNWTMAEMKKNCVENNNSHTLWGHCTACNSSTMSLPANRLLRDELYADGEEILSDLRYMQNLYIGEGDEESEWEENDDDDEEDDDACGNGGCFPEDPDVANKRLDAAKEMYYYNVNKLISDLLRPETVKQLTQVLGEQNQKTIMEGIMSERADGGAEAPQPRALQWKNYLPWMTTNPAAPDTTWSEWKESQGGMMDRDEISYNISDDHLRCLMRDNNQGGSDGEAVKPRPDRKRRHSASQNVPEDISMGFRSKFHGNAMLKEAWDAYEPHPAEGAAFTEPTQPLPAGKFALNSSSIFSRVTMVSRPLTR